MNIEVYVERDLYVKLKEMSKEEFNSYLLNKLNLLEKYLVSRELKELKDKIRKIKERKKMIEEEIKFLEELNTSAKRERKILEEWILKLREENNLFIRKMEGKE